MIAGRPLRFLAVIALGWVGARAFVLWPGSPALAVAGDAIVPRVAAAALPLAILPAVSWQRPVLVAARLADPLVRASAVEPLAMVKALSPPSMATVPTSSTEPGIIAGLPNTIDLPTASTPAATRSRFFGSAWLFVRGGNGTAGGIAAPQLGGSQAGLRIAYALTEDRRLALAARLATPLGKGARDLALGVEWQPTRLPVRVIAEQRFGLRGGRGGPTIGLVGGAGPLPIAAGFDLESYAQAGVIGRDGGEGYADGAARVAKSLATIGAVRVDLGAGAWGAAQRGASRVDIGPSLTVHVPLGTQPVRVSLDWRQRVAGNATPDSGLVLTIGADF